jgi:hypothetical protein
MSKNKPFCENCEHEELDLTQSPCCGCLRRVETLEARKQEFIEWLEHEADISAYGLSTGTLYISEVLDKAKEML